MQLHFETAFYWTTGIHFTDNCGFGLTQNRLRQTLMTRRFLHSFIPCMLLLGLMVGNNAVAEEIRISTGEYPPWTSKQLSEGGYINMLVRKAFNEVGVSVTYDYMPWNRALEATRVGQYPASSFWGYDPARDTDFSLSDRIHTDPILLAHRQDLDYPAWETLKDLNAFVFGATRGYTYTADFWQLIDSNVLRVSVSNSDLENLEKLIDGHIDFFPISRTTGRYLLHKNFTEARFDQIRFDSRPINSSLDFLLFSKAHPDAELLREKFNQGLARLKARGLPEKLLKSYMSACCSFD